MQKPDASDALFLRLFEMKPRKGDLKKIAILRTAIELIGTKGIESTNFDTVGKAMGIGRSHIAYYFKTREALIDAAIRAAYATGQEITVEAVRKAHTRRERVTAMIEAAFTWVERYPMYVAVVLAFYHYCTYAPAYRALNHEIREVGRQRLRAILVGDTKLDAQRSAELDRACVDVQNFVTGAIIEFFTTNSKISLRELARVTTELALDRLQKFLR